MCMINFFDLRSCGIPRKVSEDSTKKHSFRRISDERHKLGWGLLCWHFPNVGCFHRPVGKKAVCLQCISTASSLCHLCHSPSHAPARLGPGWVSTAGLEADGRRAAPEGPSPAGSPSRARLLSCGGCGGASVAGSAAQPGRQRCPRRDDPGRSAVGGRGRVALRHSLLRILRSWTRNDASELCG